MGDEKSQAELDILIAADRWAREMLRLDKFLDPFEQRLMEAVLHYQRLTRSTLEVVPIQLPKPPPLPKDLVELTTDRYSDIPTRPSPPKGIKAISKEDIDELELDEDW